MTKIGLIQFLLLFLISAAYGQKVKYKDIYALLSTKQFEQAEPFLKSYLKETADNPNAFLFMGSIFQEKASRNDVLKQTSVALANMDSAILYYDRAYKSIDEREVRKNKDYYQSYNRRDLRTGEFGVKLSDIQFDIEKKIEALKERIDKVKMVKYYFALADSTYRRSNALYLLLQKRYPTQNQLYLRADENTIADLKTLSMRFDSCAKAFERYLAANATAGKTGYQQRVTLAAIEDFRKDGRDIADLYQQEVKWWDYKTFADDALGVIEKEILPMRKHLIAYDLEINKLRGKLKADSVSVRSDLTKLIDRLLYDQLKKFDPEPLPTTVFALKSAELAYRSMKIEHAPLRDSSDLHLQIRLLQQEAKLLSELDSAAQKLPDENIDAKASDYADFISSAYNSVADLKRFVRTLKDFGAAEQRENGPRLAAYTRALNYIVDGSDTIPLIDSPASKFRPLVVTPENFTVGVSTRDTTQLQGYFYTITASRRADVKAYFPLDKSVLNISNVTATRGLSYADASGQIYYLLIYRESAQQEKLAATLAKIYRSDGLAWRLDCPLSFAPNELLVSADTGDLVIKNGALQVVVDKNGKLKE